MNNIFRFAKMDSITTMVVIKITQKSIQQSYATLIKRAKLDVDFIVLTIIGAAICSFGFKMDSPAVIIGAMVISPLIYSVVSIGVASYKADWKTLRHGLTTLIVGLITAIIVAVIINYFVPVNHRSEVNSRLVNSPVDYFIVSFFCGLAGTFAFFWPGITASVIGIAISVALIPPVVLVGIGLGNMDYMFTLASGKIVLINILGIYFGTLITFTGLHFLSKND